MSATSGWDPHRPPTAVMWIGQNYAAHAAESGDLPPKYPIFFFKHPNTVAGSGSRAGHRDRASDPIRETFDPLRPYLIPADEVDPQRLGLRSWVNGEPRQDSTTADMIFSLHHLVWDLS
jgi:2,4-didehydro-3-deoxy-L-rhamnonate hydrolase